jgi:hypothetical protein
MAYGGPFTRFFFTMKEKIVTMKLKGTGSRVGLKKKRKEQKGRSSVGLPATSAGPL